MPSSSPIVLLGLLALSLVHQTLAINTDCDAEFLEESLIPSHICPDHDWYYDKGCDVEEKLVEYYCKESDSDLMFGNCVERNTSPYCCLAPIPTGMIQLVGDKGDKAPQYGNAYYGYAELEFNFVTSGGDVPVFEILVNSETLRLTIEDAQALETTSCDGDEMRVGSFELAIPLIASPGTNRFTVKISANAADASAPQWDGIFDIDPESTPAKGKFEVSPKVQKKEDKLLHSPKNGARLVYAPPNPPSTKPTTTPTTPPTTSNPTKLPTRKPSGAPTSSPSTTNPTNFPTIYTTSAPTSSAQTRAPTATQAPSNQIVQPSLTASPTSNNSTQPVAGGEGSWIVGLAAGLGALGVVTMLSLGGLVYRKSLSGKSDTPPPGSPTKNFVTGKKVRPMCCIATHAHSYIHAYIYIHIHIHTRQTSSYRRTRSQES
jgi:hypothetical protein